MTSAKRCFIISWSALAMQQINDIIMIKPDALITNVSCERAEALFHAYANHLFQKYIYAINNDMFLVQETAEEHVSERSVDEVSFQGELNKAAIEFAPNMANIISEFKGDNIPVSNVIIGGLRAMGCRLLSSCKYVLKEHDVDIIYSLNTIDNQKQNLATSLHNYLDNQEVMLLKVSNTYGSHLLHHWKTYVRHFCIIKRTERYPLCNLLHVSEEDYEYLDKLLYKCSLLERSND